MQTEIYPAEQEGTYDQKIYNGEPDPHRGDSM